MKISFVIPCYRSEATLVDVVNEIIATVSTRSDDYEIIMVNDNSPDNVYDIIKDLCKNNSKLKAIDFAKNFGQHAALMAGYSLCTGDIVFSVDDDGQAPIDELYSLIDKINEGYDVVYGAYKSRKHSFFRNFGSKVNEIMSRILIGKPKNLKQTSFFAAKKFVITEILKYNNAYPYIGGLMIRTTSKIANVVVNHRERQSGKSGYTLKKLLSLWFNGFTAFSVKPLRISSILGLFCSFLGMIYGIYTIVRKLIDPNIIIGYSSTLAVILFIGGIIMLMLGLIGEYLGRIYICINKSPQYVIREKIDYSSNEIKKDENMGIQ